VSRRAIPESFAPARVVTVDVDIWRNRNTVRSHSRWYTRIVEIRPKRRNGAASTITPTRMTPNQ
jgi:hypothetical protein